MSIERLENEHDHACLNAPCAGIEMVIEPRCRDIGGFTVNRLLPFAKQRMVGPWVFFDHMGPVRFHEGEGVDVRPHPHINLATVTYLLEGTLCHRDSLGTVQTIIPGAVNLMVAGKGIVHSERSPKDRRHDGEVMEGLQLWLALPEDDEETDPAFYHYESSVIPSVQVDGVNVRVLIGSAFGVSSPVKQFASTLYCEIRMDKGQRIRLPQAEAMAAYVVHGSVRVNDQLIGEHHMAVFSKNATIELYAHEATHMVVIGGEPLTERHVYWNFVSSRKERLEQAKQDWLAGRFPEIDGETGGIPLPG